MGRSQRILDEILSPYAQVFSEGSVSFIHTIGSWSKRFILKFNLFILAFQNGAY